MAEKQQPNSKPHLVSSQIANKTTQEPCQHKWEYSTQTHAHECIKCGIPAPANWNEVGF